MAFISLPNGIKIEIIMRRGNAPIVNVIFLTSTSHDNLAFLETLTETVITWWNANMKPLVSSTTTLNTVKATDWHVQNGAQFTNDLLTPSAGTATGDDTSNNVATVTTFLTGFSGRSYRGRVYNSGLTHTQYAANTLNTAYVAAMLTAWVAFKTAVDSDGAQHVVASFYTNNAPRVTGVATPIISYSMNNVVDTQRRRIPRVTA